MASLNGFNASEVEPTAGFGPIPAGSYEGLIIDSEMRSTKAGTGRFLQLKLQITDGDYRGRILWDRLNLDNPSTTAVQIARAGLPAQVRHDLWAGQYPEPRLL